MHPNIFWRLAAKMNVVSNFLSSGSKKKTEPQKSRTKLVEIVYKTITSSGILNVFLL